MKKVLILSVLIIYSIFLISFASAACNLKASLLNQDPYPAVPGDYVKVVFQLEGTQNSDCGDVYFQLEPQYPISFDPGVASDTTIKSGTFLNDYKSSLVIPFKVRVDQNAIDGDNLIKVRYAGSSTPLNGDSYIVKMFNISVKNVKTDFEAYVKNFDFSTNMLTIQILNSGKSNVEALTIEIPEQKNVTVKGSNRNIAGSLDANEYTTSDFEILPVENDIVLNIYYTDSIGVRRETNSTIHFDPSYFQGRKSQQTSSSTWIWVVLVIVVIVIYLIYRRYKNNKKKRLAD